MSSWIPDRKYLAGGISGVLSFFILKALSTWLGWAMDEATITQIAGLIAAAMAYLIPSSVGDTLTKIDNILKSFGGSATTPSGTIVSTTTTGPTAKP